MARFNKMFVKKLYMPDGKEKGQHDQMTLVTATASELNIMDGVTATTAQLNQISGGGIIISTANASAINITVAQTDETGWDGACVFKHGTYSTALAYGTQTNHLVLHSTHITAGATGKYVIGKFLGIDSSAVSTGYFIGNYNYLTVNHNVGAAMAMYAEVDVTTTAALAGNVSGLYTEMICAAGAVTGAGKINGVLVEMKVTAGVTIAQELHGIEVDMRGIKADIAGRTVGIKVTQAGGSNYLDYGMQFSNCFDTATAVLDFDLTQSNTAIGILMDSGAFTITTGINLTGTVTIAISLASAGTNAIQILGTHTYLFDLPATGTGFVVANALVPSAAPDGTTVGADACLTVDVNGTPYYIALYDTLHGA